MYPSLDALNLVDLEARQAYWTALAWWTVVGSAIVGVCALSVSLWYQGYQNRMGERIAFLRSQQSAEDAKKLEEQIKLESQRKTDELQDSITRRDLDIRKLDTGLLSQHRGIKVSILSRPEAEPTRVANELATVLRFSHWDVVQSAQRDEYFENGICVSVGPKGQHNAEAIRAENTLRSSLANLGLHTGITRAGPDVPGDVIEVRVGISERLQPPDVQRYEGKIGGRVEVRGGVVIGPDGVRRPIDRNDIRLADEKPLSEGPARFDFSVPKIVTLQAGKPFGAIISIQNTGGERGFLWEMNFLVQITNKDVPFDQLVSRFEQHQPQKPDSLRLWPPEKVDYPISPEGDLTKEIVAGIEAGKLVLTLFGRMVSQDDMHQRRKIWFCYAYDATDKEFVPFKAYRGDELLPQEASK